jgi:hypothetical protein
MRLFNIKGQGNRRTPGGVLAAIVGGLTLTLSPISYSAEESGPPHTQSAAAIGAALSNPLSDVWALFTEIDYSFSDGDLSDKRWRNGQSVIFQPIMPIPLTDDWKMITRPTLPIIINNDVPVGRRHDTIDLPGGNGVLLKEDGNAVFDSENGFGDLSIPLLFTKKSDRSWNIGGGPTFLFPTGEEPFSSDTYEVGPGVVLTLKTGNFSGALLGQYWWNYAEQDNDTPDTSHGSLLYSAWWSLPDAWQVGFNPTITYNNETRSGDKWSVPIGMGAAKTIKFGKLPIKFQFSVEKHVIRQDDFGADVVFRLNIIPVIPGLVKSPLFN